MKRKISKFMALCLAAVVGMTTVLPQEVHATQIPDAGIEQTTDTKTNQANVSANDIVSVNDIDDKEVFGEEGKLNYLYLGSKYIETPGSEQILISFGDEETVVANATLTVQNYETKEKTKFYSEETMDNTVLFTMDYTEEEQGIYEVVSAEVKTDDGKTKTVKLSRTGMENVYFGVNQEVVLSEEKPISVEESVEMQIVTFDEGDASKTSTTQISNAVEDAINEAETNVEDGTIALGASMSLMSALNIGTIGTADTLSAGGNLVVVLDPGHDSTHAGARANGLKEEDLTLKIAQYCKAELEKYAGVTVYMTRNSSACPFPGTSSTDDNANRVAYAQSVGADVFVSIHLNSASSSSASGAEVFYPNSNYNSAIGSAGANLSAQISRQLAALGLNNRGITIRNSGDGTKYPDGSLADYYGVIRRSKLAGFPAVIIEHAFLTNASDAAFLSQESNLQKLGIADATGIANYYGLSQGYDIQSNAPTVQSYNDAKGTFTIGVTGVTPYDKVSKVKFAVWSAGNGQDDLRWYEADNLGNGSFSKNINISDHGSQPDTYIVHVYAEDIRGTSYLLGAVDCTMKRVSPVVGAVSAVVSTDEKTATITASGVSGVGDLRFAVWSDVNGQDDIVWYTAKDNGNGTWSAQVPVANHNGSSGKYTVHTYGQNAYVSNCFLGNASFVITGPSVGKVEFKDVNNGSGTFSVVINGISSKSGIASVDVAVWSKGDQSNLRWYQAVRQSDGTYRVDVNIANHGYEYGLYRAHVYVKDRNGISGFTSGNVDFKQPTAFLLATGNGNQTEYSIKATNVGYPGGVTGVWIAVWSNENGQDDLIWYPASNSGNGVWSVVTPIRNHRSAGAYSAHMYIVDRNGTWHFGANTTFTVTKPTPGKVEFTNINNGAGKFTVKVGGAASLSGIASVDVAVWSKGDQSNLRWYSAVKQSDGTYCVDVDLANHGYEYGVYHAHAYVKSNNGISVLTAGNVEMKQPTAFLTATGNGNQTQYVINASNVGYAGGVTGVWIAVWSNENGQDDLIWYPATNSGSGVWSTNVPIINHKSAGNYSAHMYIVDRNGNWHFGANTGFTVTKPTAGTVKIKNANSGTGKFTVEISGATAVSGIAGVDVAVWSKSDQSNLRWYSAVKQSDGTYRVDVDIASHGYEYGVYHAHAYVKSNNGISLLTAGSVEMKQPTAILTATGNGNQSEYTITATNVGYAGGVKGIWFIAWSNQNGQDDVIWYPGTNNGNGVWSATVPVRNHKSAGAYSVHMYIIDQNGGLHLGGASGFEVTKVAANSVEVVDKIENDGTFGVRINGVSSISGVADVKVAVWCAPDQGDLVWYRATDLGGGNYQIGADVRNHQSNTGTYHAHAYVTGYNGVVGFVGAVDCSMINVTNILHPIMGSSAITVDQMVSYYNSVASYPGYYAGTEAPTIRQFCQIYLDECNAEGVKAEVAFVQAMKETNFLRFGGDVSISQFNFAGIGATGNGAKGNSFASVTVGIRAQVQHLKAYASNEALNQACVDPRFQYVARNTAPYCEWLGIKENPYGKGWATAVNYGYNIVERINKLKTY